MLYVAPPGTQPRRTVLYCRVLAKRILFNNTCSSPSSTPEYLLNMLPTVFVRSLEIVQLLPQILHLRFEFRRLLAQSFFRFVSRTGDKPITSQKITDGKTRHAALLSFT